MLDLGTLQINIKTNTADAKKELQGLKRYVESAENEMDSSTKKSTSKTASAAKASSKEVKASADGMKEALKEAQEAARRACEEAKDSAFLASQEASESAFRACEAAKEAAAKAAEDAAKAGTEASKQAAKAAEDAANAAAKAYEDVEKAADDVFFSLMDETEEAAEKAAKEAEEAAEKTKKAAEEAAKAAEEAAKEAAEAVEKKSNESTKKVKYNLEALEPAFKKVGEVGKKAFDKIKRGATLAAGAIAGMTGQAVDAIAEYEQLEGGVKKVFGKAHEKMKDYAFSAWETMGLGANDYLRSAMTVSAFIKNSSKDEFEAADKVNQMMSQAADNASMYGTNLETVIDVYKNLAKGQYETLDNLLLPYKGTKEGIQQLLTDAQSYSGETYDINNFNDIIDAIGEVQNHMKMTGNAQEEAGKTISGSINKTKAAYQNWLLSLDGSDEEVQKSTDEMAQSAVDSANKIIPLVKQIIGSIFDALPGKAKVAIAAIGGLVGAFATLKGVLSVVNLVNNLTSAMKALKAANEGARIAQILLNAAMGANPIAIVAGLLAGLIATLVILWNTNEGFRNAVTQAFTDMIFAVQGFFDGLAEGVSGAINSFLTFCSSVGASIGHFFTVTIPEKGQQAIDWFSKLPGRLLKALGDVGSLLLDSGKKLITGLLNGLKEKWEGIKTWFSEKLAWIRGESANAGTDVANNLENAQPTNGGGGVTPHAAGGIFTKPTLLGRHLVGEAGSEAIIPLKQSVLATMGAGMAAAYAGAGGAMGTTTVNNYYLNNAVVNQDKEIQDKFISLMSEIRRKGGM